MLLFRSTAARPRARSLRRQLPREERFALAQRADGSPVTLERPARQGEILTVLGTGFGPYDVRTPGLGLLLIQHYGAQVPISVLLRSVPGKGTMVRSTWALPPSNSTSHED